MSSEYHVNIYKSIPAPTIVRALATFEEKHGYRPHAVAVHPASEEAAFTCIGGVQIIVHRAVPPGYYFCAVRPREA